MSEIIAYCIESILFLPSGLILFKIGIFILPTTKKKLCCAVFQTIILNTSCCATSSAGPVAWRTSISLSLCHWLWLWSSLWYQYWLCSCSCSCFCSGSAPVPATRSVSNAVAGFQCGFDAGLAFMSLIVVLPLSRRFPLTSALSLGSSGLSPCPRRKQLHPARTA